VTTLIAVYTSQGCVGRCDARCYGAVEPECECICCGANHGVGFARAAQNTLLYAQRWVERHHEAHPDHDVVVPGLQQELTLGVSATARRGGARAKTPVGAPGRVIHAPAQRDCASLSPEFSFLGLDEDQSGIGAEGLLAESVMDESLGRR
jgi:predicted short-subunit dehydrogenase-like oxidoreductase (DUF2520 family)